MSPFVRISVQLTPHDWARLRDEARTTERSLAGLIRQILRDHLARRAEPVTPS
jgi:Ribbon-helix-helix protein, copG family